MYMLFSHGTLGEGLPVRQGKTTLGMSSPANPAFNVPDPLSIVTAAPSITTEFFCDSPALMSFSSSPDRDTWLKEKVNKFEMISGKEAYIRKLIGYSTLLGTAAGYLWNGPEWFRPGALCVLSG